MWILQTPCTLHRQCPSNSESSLSVGRLLPQAKLLRRTSGAQNRQSNTQSIRKDKGAEGDRYHAAGDRRTLPVKPDVLSHHLSLKGMSNEKQNSKNMSTLGWEMHMEHMYVFALWSWTLRIRWGIFTEEREVGRKGVWRGKGWRGAGSIPVCQQRHWTGATVARSAPLSARFFDFCTILQLHRPSALLQKLLRITFLAKNNTEKIDVVVVWKGWLCHLSIWHFLLSDYSFINSWHCCITVKNSWKIKGEGTQSLSGWTLTECGWSPSC